MEKIIEFGTKLFDLVDSMPNELSTSLTEKADLVAVEDINDAERNIYNGVQNLAPETVVGCFPTFTKDKREELVEFAKQLTVVLTPKQYLDLCEAVNGVYVEESRVLFETALEQDPKLEFNKEYAEFGNEMFEMQLGMNAWERFMDNLPQDCINKNVLLAEPKWYNYLPEFKDKDEMWDFATELVSEMNSVEYDDYNPKTASKIVERTQKILNERNEELGRMVDIQRFILENVYGKYGEHKIMNISNYAVEPMNWLLANEPEKYEALEAQGLTKDAIEIELLPYAIVGWAIDEKKDSLYEVQETFDCYLADCARPDLCSQAIDKAVSEGKISADNSLISVYGLAVEENLANLEFDDKSLLMCIGVELGDPTLGIWNATLDEELVAEIATRAHYAEVSEEGLDAIEDAICNKDQDGLGTVYADALEKAEKEEELER